MNCQYVIVSFKCQAQDVSLPTPAKHHREHLVHTSTQQTHTNQEQTLRLDQLCQVSYQFLYYLGLQCFSLYHILGSAISLVKSRHGSGSQDALLPLVALLTIEHSHSKSQRTISSGWCVAKLKCIFQQAVGTIVACCDVVRILCTLGGKWQPLLN